MSKPQSFFGHYFRLIYILFITSCFVQSDTRALSEPAPATVTIYRFGPELEAASGVPPQIYIDGPINEQTLDLLKLRLEAENIDKGIVYLNSLGGDLLSGISMGIEIRQRGFSTGIAVKGADYTDPKPGRCFSACVLAYVGGYYRFSKGESTLGVHRFSRASSSSYDLDDAQIISAKITTYLNEMDVDTRLFGEMTRADKDQINVLSYEDATNLRVINNGKLPATWNLENVGGLIYLKGQQETVIGTGKFMLTCAKEGKPLITIFYDAGERADRIASTSTRYSMRVDRDFLPIDKLEFEPQIKNNNLFTMFLTSSEQWQRILNATLGLGFAFHPPNPNIFYGFLIETANGQDQIRNLAKHCSSNKQ